MKLYFDLETAPLPLEQLLPIMPEFEVGANLKDPDKIKAAIKAKKQDWIDGCALKPTTGRVIAASWCWNNDEPVFMANQDEKVLVQAVGMEIMTAIGNGGNCYAFNAFGFDLPFLAARLAVHGNPSFHKFTTNYRGRWSWSEAFIDPMQIWSGPYQRSDGASLKAVGYSLGLGLKVGNGKDFSELLKNDLESAKAYVVMDVKLLRGIVEKMGI